MDTNTLTKSSRFINRFDAGPFDVKRAGWRLGSPNTSLRPQLIGLLLIATIILVTGMAG